MGRYFSALFARKRLLLYELKAVGRSENLGVTTDIRPFNGTGVTYISSKI